MRRTQARPAAGAAATQADRLVRHCVYMIATGKWRAGQRLPSIRETRREWRVNQAAAQQAYGRLQEMGLAESRPRSGWFVAGGGTFDRLSRHRYELENLLRNTARTIRERTGLSALGALRYLAELEEIRRREEPEIAFVECTDEQASAHAGEIAARFRVPVMPLTSASLSRKRSRVPHHVRVLLTSPFHFQEIRKLADPPNLKAAAVPIEVSPGVLGDLGKRRGRIVLLEREQSMAEHIAADASRLLGGARPLVRVVEEPGPAVKEILEEKGKGSPPAVLLSPRLWGELQPEWRAHPRVRQVAFRVTEAAWPGVADAIGLPLGL